MDVAQLEERCLAMAEIAGSIPVIHSELDRMIGGTTFNCQCGFPGQDPASIVLATVGVLVQESETAKEVSLSTLSVWLILGNAAECSCDYITFCSQKANLCCVAATFVGL